MLIKRISLLFCLLLSLALHAQTWREITPGIEYLDLPGQKLPMWTHIHAFRIDLHRQELAIVLAKTIPSSDQIYAPNFKRYSHSLMAINGGFFSSKSNPLGLRISHYQQINPLKPISWWGVFYIKNQKAHMVNLNGFHAKDPEFAIQAGPRLLVNKDILALKPGLANRSAIGIDTNGQVIILVTENLPLSTTELASIMRNPPLNCEQALNLDGGNSSQLYAHMKQFHLNVLGLSEVSDAIVVKPRTP